MTARELLRSAADRADEYVAEHDHCLFCFLVCPLAHDHHTEDERYCIYGHADDCPAPALRALAARIDSLERDVADRQRALNNSVELHYLRIKHGEGEAQHREISLLRASLGRLDAPLQKEPR